MHKSIWMFLLMLFATSVFADEASVRKIIEGKFPGSKLESVTKSGYGGFYEIYMDGKMGYTDEQVTFLLVGFLVDTKTSQNVTQQRLRKLTGVNVKEIPLDQGIRKVKGNGKRQLIVFSDPMCPFCKQLEKEIEKLDNVTTYIMLYPIEHKFKGTTELSKQIWCSSDRGKAWDDWMLRGIKPTAPPTCKDPIARIEQVGSKLRLDNTPSVIFADGGIVLGVLPAAQLEKLLNDTPSK